MRGLIAAATLAVFATAPATAAAEPTPAPPQPPGLDTVLAPATLLMPENYRMPTGEQPSPYELTEGVPPGPFPLVDGLKGVHALIHGALGRMPGGDLGQALPGTAPPPGTALPPGLEQYLPVPPTGSEAVPVIYPTVPPPPA